MRNRIILAAVLLVLGTVTARAQNLALSTNAVGYLEYGTLNLEASLSVARQWTVTAGAQYNPFHFKAGEDQHDVNHRQRLLSAGARWWPWHVFSGWWVAGKLQYQEYNFGGVRSPETVEGDRIGFGASVGYTYMLAKHFNLELGIGGWGGADFFTRYECPVCGLTLDKGTKPFILPNDITVAISYIF